MRLRLLVPLAALLLTSTSAQALEQSPSSYYLTGQGVRHKKVGFMHVKVYSIASYVKELPKQHSERAIIDLDANKVLTWRMLRKVESDKIKNALKEAYERNGYRDQAKIDQALSAFSQKKFPDGAVVTISYDAAKKLTTITTSTGGHVEVPGTDFMHATWSIWFGNIDEPSLTASLMSRLRG